MPWSLANPFGIQVHDGGERGVSDAAWHAGHINDILSVEPGHILVASESGGVWYIDGGYNATPLSHDWLYPDVECLASGPGGPTHVFAGCQGGMYEAVVSPQHPRAPWKRVNLPGQVKIVYRIVATRDPPLIAMATDAGIWWADATQLPGGYPSGHYAWQPAKNLPQEAFFGLALSFDGIIAGVRNLEGSTKRRGIYYGAWADGLTMQRAGVNLSNKAVAAMRMISLASCPRDRTRAYALAVDERGRIRHILRSRDGGKTWDPCSRSMEGKHDGSWDITKFCGDKDSGGWHKTIGVHTHDPDVVGFGGLRSVISTNGGQSWRGLGGSFTAPDRWDYDNHHQHDDVHALYFEPGFSEKRLYIASDGGVVRAEDWSTQPVRFRSAMNRNLANLQFYSAMEVIEFWGTIGASSREPLIGGGLQDNGNVGCSLRPYPEVWQKIDGGDGGWVALLVAGAPAQPDYDELVSNTMGQAVGHAVWRRPAFAAAGSIPLRPPIVVRGQTFQNEGLKGPVAEVVPRPKWMRTPGNLMLAVGAATRFVPPTDEDGKPDNRLVFGLFGTEGEDALYWSKIGELPAGAAPVSALGTDTGQSVYAGTADGKIYLIDAASGYVAEMGVNPPSNGGAVVRIVSHLQRGQFAVIRNKTVKRSHLMKLDGGWNEIKGTQPPPTTIYYGFDIYRGPGPVTMALATATDVWISPDDGETWFRSVLGLPAVPHCTDLRFGRLDGADVLFLGTYGRSIWMIEVNELWERREQPIEGPLNKKFLPQLVPPQKPQSGGKSVGKRPRSGARKTAAKRRKARR